MFIDSHFHIREMVRKKMDAASLLSEAHENGLKAALDIGITPDDWDERSGLLASFPWIIRSAGIYPGGSTGDYRKTMIPRLEKILSGGEAAAVGEIGIDLHWNYATPEKQKELMTLQIKLANRFHLPVIIHNREADREVMSVLEAVPPEAGGIIHCFSSDRNAAARFTESGFYISFAGNVTYRNAETIQEAAAAVPADKILVETDAPYLSPLPKRGRPNHPGNIGHTYAFIADLRGMTREDLEKSVMENYFTLFPQE